jgi:AcrR family transcriptional regulator
MNFMNSGVNAPTPAQMRRARAAANRARMVQSAAGLFAARGFSGTTMEAVAEASGMSVQSVYFGFRTKANLLQAAFDQAALGPVEPTPPPRSDWYRAAEQASTLEESLGLFVRGNCHILEGTTPLTIAAASAAAGDPAVAEIHERNEQLRMDVLGGMTAHLADRYPLRPGMTEAKAVDVVFGLLSPQLFALLVGSRGWSPADFAAWAADVIRRDLWIVGEQPGHGQDTGRPSS